MYGEVHRFDSLALRFALDYASFLKLHNLHMRAAQILLTPFEVTLLTLCLFSLYATSHADDYESDSSCGSASAP
jgi:hypothetical protein